MKYSIPCFMILLSSMVSLAEIETDIESKTDSLNRFDYVDLGLTSGTLWGTTNVGALSPDDYGSFFAWGESKTKDLYSGINYDYAKGDEFGLDSLFKYNTLSEYGNVDSLIYLLPEDDVATRRLGKEWSIPTITEWAELNESCYWIWSEFNGVCGYKVVGNNNNWIFLPVGGFQNQTNITQEHHGFYWSSSLNSKIPLAAHYISFYSKYIYDFDFESRHYGMAIRPVISKRTGRGNITPPEPWRSIKRPTKDEK